MFIVLFVIWFFFDLIKQEIKLPKARVYIITFSLFVKQKKKTNHMKQKKDKQYET